MGVFKGSIKALALSSTIALSAGTAFAADILPPPPPMEAPRSMPAAEFSGWYIRGDVGIGQNRQEKFRSSFDAGFAVPGLQYDQGSMSSHLMAGVGVGYQFNSWFRADATAEYQGGARWRQVESYTGPAAPAAPCANANRCVDLYHGNISSAVFLANGYVDLGTWYNVTPYLGLGVGMANNRIGSITDNGINQGGFGTAPAVTKNNFAWAVMAGMAVNLAPNMKLDVGYRYLDKGSMNSGRIDCGGAVACGFETHRVKLASHDVRIGLRYMFGDSGYAPAPMAFQQPLIRKY